jgi:beta-phosphoglucomutase
LWSIWQGRARAILIAVNNSKTRLAFLFDMDGVLINSMPLHTKAWEVYLEGLGLKVKDLEMRMHGKRNPELVRDMIGKELSDDIVFEHGAAKERLFREMMAAQLDTYRIPGLVDFLERYPDIPKAVASNAERANIDFTLERLGLRQYFQVMVDGWEVKRPKPFPDIYLLAAERLGVSPSDCIVFEDSPTGAAAGTAAKMRTVAVETIPAEFTGVDLVVADFLDPKLQPWLAAQTSSVV